MRKIICTIFLLFIFTSHTQTSPIQEKFKSAENVYIGYFVFENLLRCIETKYPDLSYETKKNNLWLNDNFGISKENAGFFIKQKGTTNLIEYEADSKFVDCDLIDKNTALNTLKTFENEVSRMLIAENALVFKYQGNEHLEFLDGFTQMFTSKEHKKAKNSNWSLKLPKSWKAKEAKNENVIKIYQNDFGLGNATILLSVSDIPKDFSKSIDIEKSFEYDVANYLKQMFGVSKATNVLIKQMNIAFLKGHLVVFDTEIEKLGFKIKLKQYNFQFYDNDYLYTFMGNLDMTSDKVNTENFENLFYSIANSITVNKNDNNIIYLKGTKLQKQIEVKIVENNYDFVFDTGASISLINKSIIVKLLKDGTITTKDFLGKEYIITADGKKSLIEFWTVPNIKISNMKFDKLTFGVIDNDIKLLLGMNIINKLNIEKIDLENYKIYIKN